MLGEDLAPQRDQDHAAGPLGPFAPPVARDPAQSCGRGEREARGRGDVGGIGWQEIGIIVAIVIGIVIIVRLRA